MKNKLTLFLLFLTVILAAAPQGVYDWNKSRKLHNSIQHAFIYAKEPRLMKINAVRIDLNDKSLKLFAAPRDKDYGKPMPDYPSMKIETKRMKVREFLLNQRKLGKDMLIAVNSTPYGPWCKPFNHRYGGNIKLLISDGEIVSDKKVNVPAFIQRKNGKIEIRTVKKDEDRNDFSTAMAGFEIILSDGKVVAHDKNLHPRTCYGVSADNRYLYFLTVDGRQKLVSLGANTIECAEYLKYFGAAHAINMDGGGSTTLVNWNKAKRKPEVLSHQAFGGERSVATSLGIIRKNK
jgi:hypothetical protein